MVRRTTSLETMLAATHQRSAFLEKASQLVSKAFESAPPPPKNDFPSVFSFSSCIDLSLVIKILQQSLQYCLENLLATICSKGAFSLALVRFILTPTNHHSFLSVESKLYSFPL